MSILMQRSITCRMSTGAEGILVYQYSYWDEVAQMHKQSKLYATIEVIKLLGRPIYSTAMRVPPSEVIDGFYVTKKRAIGG